MTTNTLNQAAFDKLRETATRVRTNTTAIRLWEMLSVQEKVTLGNDREEAYRKGGAIGMWKAIHGCSDVRAVIEVAKKVGHLSPSEHDWLLHESGEFLSGDEAFEDAISRNELVLNACSREVYWHGEPVSVDWTHDAKWNFVWELAKHGKARRPIDHLTFGGRKNPSYVAKMKSELANADGFPLDLADKIEVVGRGSQILTVQPNEIRLFEHHIGGEVREWMP